MPAGPPLSTASSSAPPATVPSDPPAAAAAEPTPMPAPAGGERAPTPASPVASPSAPPSDAEIPSIWGSPGSVPAARFDVTPPPHTPPAAERQPAATPGPVAPLPGAPTPGDAAPRRPVNPYLSNDPGQKARRLARALVSDLIAYHPQKREEGLRAGTLKQLFREEIRKSWEEYVEQVGTQVAESTPHFQDALNDLLAGGRKVF
jgi:hypothetical protein